MVITFNELDACLNYLNMGALIGRFAWGSSWRKLRRGRQRPGSPGRPRSPFRPPEPSVPLGPSGPSKPGKPGPPVLPFSPSGPMGPFENYTVKVMNYWLIHEKNSPFCSHDIKNPSQSRLWNINQKYIFYKNTCALFKRFHVLYDVRIKFYRLRQSVFSLL